jgi:hypothetical protein
LVATAQVKEVGVIGDASFGAEVLPSPPDSIVFFVCVFLPGVKDDSAVRSIRMTQDKTSCGRGNISKERGICDGRKIWKRWVSTSSEGSSAASGWSWPLVVPVYERKSATMLFSPLRCCDARQWSLSRISVARCRATCCIAAYDSELWSTRPDRKSHPIAEVLSPKARMHSDLSLAALISSQIPTTIPRNSQRLLNRESP